jgi:2'-5' RNA ligase
MLVADARAAFLVAAPSWSREKWVRPDLVHLTLTFVGPLPDSALDDVLAAITAECSVHEPFELTASGCRAVPTDEWARMLWATLGGGTDDCTRLARGISEVLAERFSVPRDTRPFAPHLTLARAREPRPAPAAALRAASAALVSGKETDRTVSVPYVTLYASTLGSGGPTYKELGVASLGG